MFENKKILILGMARSGYEAAKVLVLNNQIVITDIKNQDEEKVRELRQMGVNLIITNEPDKILDETFDYVIKNPGIKFDNPCIVKANQLKIPITNEVEVAYQLLKGKVKIIGITGSNGKTTTTTLIYEFLKEDGIKCHLGGNIGVPVCALVELSKQNDILVLEISAHQLHDVIDFKTDIGIMTNLSEVHLDHFGTYENYKQNKLKIFDHHTNQNLAILNKENDDVMNLTKDIKSKKIYFSSKETSDCYLKNNSIYYFNELIVNITDIRIKGIHNLENIMCAVIAVKQFGVSNESIRTVLKNFAGVEHRIEYVTKINNREFYNDSKSTNVKSTQVALSTFKGPIILLLGGLNRKIPFDDLTDYLANVSHIVCYGETKNIIKEFALKVNVDCEVVDTLEEAVKVAYNISNENDTILFSPACASWDQFKDFEERGREFKKIVEKIGEEI
ncbi:MAG: UDP-N-acetylmuramoyl-L-alanine--D-glutamate ligase [Bacilli bacterium]